MKRYSRPEGRRGSHLRAVQGQAPAGELPGGIRNLSRDLTLRRDSLVWRARGGDDALWRSARDEPLRGGRWGVKGAGMPRTSLATRGRERRLNAVHICDAPGCKRMALKPCFDCGAWRCQEHLLAAVHHRKSAIVHLCPTCLHAHANDPERLRLEGFENVRAERAVDPLVAREGRTEEIAAIENNRLLTGQPTGQTERLWRLDETLTTGSSKRPVRRMTLIEE